MATDIVEVPEYWSIKQAVASWFQVADDRIEVSPIQMTNLGSARTDLTAFLATHIYLDNYPGGEYLATGYIDREGEAWFETESDAL